MTRNDEIVNRSIDYGQKTPSEYDDGRYDLSDLEWAFEEGAKWSDEHPRINLVDIDKAVRWLKDNASKFVYISAHTNLASINAHRLAEEFAEKMLNNIMEG